MIVSRGQQHPKVSILMLTRNHAAFIDKAILSILAQTCLEWELLIGEDASTDDTGQIAENAALSDPRIKVYRSGDNAIGFHSNFMRLFAAARAPYVAFLEGDDWWSEPRKLDLQISLLDSNPDLAFCGGYTRIVDERISNLDNTSTIGPPSNITRLAFVDLIRSYSFHFSSVLMRAQYVCMPNWIFRQYCLDRPLYLLAARYGDAGVVNYELSVYRLHQGGVWAPLSPLQKAIRSQSLFMSFCQYFPSRYCREFRRTLSSILWSYLGLSLQSANRRQSLSILMMAVSASPRLRFVDFPRLTLGAIARILF